MELNEDEQEATTRTDCNTLTIQNPNQVRLRKKFNQET